MLPTDNSYGTWPRSGEIDILESRGNADYSCGGWPVGRQMAQSTLHWGPDAGQNRWSTTHWEKSNIDTTNLFWLSHVLIMTLNCTEWIMSTTTRPVSTFTVSSGIYRVVSNSLLMMKWLAKWHHRPVDSGKRAGLPDRTFGPILTWLHSINGCVLRPSLLYTAGCP